MRILHTLLALAALATTTARATPSAPTPQALTAQGAAVLTDLLKGQLDKEGDVDPEIKAKEKEKRKIELENDLARAQLEKDLATLRGNIMQLKMEQEVINLKWELAHKEKQKAHAEEMLHLNQQKEMSLSLQ